MSKIKRGSVIGISGVARSGKDTAGYYAQELLYEQNTQLSKTCGFADLLKKDVDKFCWTQFEFTAFTKIHEQKNLIRPLLVAYGTHIRRAADKNYWIDRLQPTVDFFASAGHNIIITDVRYENEVDWIHEIHKGKCIHVSREETKAANAEEKRNDPTLMDKSDTQIHWATFGEKNLKKAKPKVKKALKSLNLI